MKKIGLMAIIAIFVLAKGSERLLPIWSPTADLKLVTLPDGRIAAILAGQA